MNKTFAADYEAYEKINKDYHEADARGDEAGKEQAKEAYQTWAAGIEAKGQDYTKIFRLYMEARKVGNTYIDLHDTIWDKDVKGLVEAMRANGIERFTFSSTWSSAVETAWLFQKEGCTLEGLIEINSQHQAFLSNEYEKAHGYLFRVG
jgi:hypothetical protein